jgi:preprotein translocase subunit SecA
MNSIWADFARMIYNVEVQIEAENGQEPGPVPGPPQQTGSGLGALAYSGGSLEDQPSAYGGEGYDVDAGEPHEMPVVQQRRVDEHAQIGRNDPCWCGSGKKFKKCHGA